MNRFTLPRRAAWAVLFALGSLAAIAGCSKKTAVVDPGYTTLEGRPDAKTLLLAWADTPDTSLVFQDLDPRGPDLPSADSRVDVLTGREANYRTGPGVLNLLLLDGTAASGYQFYRRANNGGLEAVTDYIVRSSMKSLPDGLEIYTFADEHPSSYAPATYVARGVLDGRVTTISPVSNEAIASGPAAQASISLRYIAATKTVRDSAITWTTVPGAARYWLDIYLFKATASFQERIASGTPTPIMTGSVAHALIRQFDGVGAGPSITYHLSLPPGIQFLARVTAVDANSRVIAWSRSRTQDEDPYFDDWLLRQGAGTYTFFPLAATPVPALKHN
jgi:hypothetical protein